jgi:hypothetical protein
MTDQPDITAEELDAYFAVLDRARTEADATQAAFVARLHAQQRQLAADMPRLLEERFGVTLPEGVHFEWQDNCGAS